MPLVGPGVKVLGSVLNMADKKQQKIMLARYADIAIDSTEMNRFSEAISREAVCLDGLDFDKSNPSMLRRMLSGASDRVVSLSSNEPLLASQTASEAIGTLFDDLEEEANSSVDLEDNLLEEEDDDSTPIGVIPDVTKEEDES